MDDWNWPDWAKTLFSLYLVTLVAAECLIFSVPAPAPTVWEWMFRAFIAAPWAALGGLPFTGLVFLCLKKKGR